MRFLCKVSSILNFLHSSGDRFAAQIVYAAGRCPPIFRLATDCLSFHLLFHGLRLDYGYSICNSSS